MNGLKNKIGPIALIGLALVGFYACSEDKEDLPPSGERLSQTELQTLMGADELSGVADDAIAALYNSHPAGKTATAVENECYSAIYTDLGFVASFNNCFLNGSDSVNGTVTVTYAIGGGSATFTASFEDFYVGTIKLVGTRTFSLAAGSDENTGSFTVTSDMTAELEDGSIVGEKGSKTITIGYDDQKQVLTFGLTGNWTVESDGNTYSIETLDTVQGDSGCEYLNKGSVLVSKNGLEVTVDFGNGDCDNKVTLIYPNGAQVQLTL